MIHLDADYLRSLWYSLCRIAQPTFDATRPSTAETVLNQCRRRLASDPHDQAAMHVVAASLLYQSKPKSCLELVLQDPGSASQLESTAPLTSRLTGLAYLQLGHIDPASHYLNEAVGRDPNQPDAWLLLGKIADHQHDVRSAIRYYKRGMLLEWEPHECALALSELQMRLRKLKEAIHTLRVNLLRDERSPSLNRALGRLLIRRAQVLGRRQKKLAQRLVRQEALKCYRDLNAVQPSTESLIAQGRMEQHLYEYERAQRAFQKAVQLNPESMSAIAHLASANVDNGNLADAATQFENVLQREPHRADVHFKYSRAKKFHRGEDSDRYRKQLAALIDQPDHSVAKRIHFHFAMAKVLDDCGDHDQAWGHFDRANRLKQLQPGKTQVSNTDPPTDTGDEPLIDFDQNDVPGDDPALHQAPLEHVMKHTEGFFTPSFFTSHALTGNSSKTPIFIVGMPRSGTTLTEQILSSHPQIAGAGELDFINQIRQEILRGHPPRVPNPERPKQRTLDWKLYPRLLAETPVDELRYHAKHYLEQLEPFRDGAVRVTDKMPTNFIHLGMIGMLFPQATIIHCRRDPLDVMVSCYCQNLNLPFCDLDQLVIYHRHYRRLMAHWRRVLPQSIHTVDYENLVSDPEPPIRALIQHADLPWDDACLSFHRNERAVHTPSKWQVRQPMYASSIAKWKRFEKHLAPVAAQIRSEMDAEARQAAVS